MMITVDFHLSWYSVSSSVRAFD